LPHAAIIVNAASMMRAALNDLMFI
jgi:hypothetical protein